ncbi:MAG: metal-sensitive transcriptional regulator [Ardenticatenales bacterium]|nr:metal-sensitive transcriptional regulator [Ardenticatenales bacterium]
MSEEQQALIRRLRSIEGHVRGVERMVEEGQYCIDIIHQTQAIKRALDKLEHELLSNHLASCVTTAMRSEDVNERERVIGELLEVFDAKNKI